LINSKRLLFVHHIFQSPTCLAAGNWQQFQYLVFRSVLFKQPYISASYKWKLCHTNDQPLVSLPATKRSQEAVPQCSCSFPLYARKKNMTQLESCWYSESKCSVWGSIPLPFLACEACGASLRKTVRRSMNYLQLWRLKMAMGRLVASYISGKGQPYMQTSF
jgi:hypothetical protein